MTDHVFGGMTRPPTVLGVPQAVFGGLLIVAIFGMMLPVALGWSLILSIGAVAFSVLSYLTARFLCERDHNVFRYLQVRFLLAVKIPGRKLGRSMTTYCPAPLRKR